MSTSPFLSVVVVGRNDNYGGRFLTNLNQFVCNLAILVPNAELVVVDWNPPKDRPTLREEMFWPIGLQGKVITVAPEIHNTLSNPHNLPLLEYYAKNVGIRRAQGEYILSTNPDTLLSISLANKLNSRTLKYGEYYRANRVDVQPLPGKDLYSPLVANSVAHYRRIIKHCRLGSYNGVDLLSRVKAVARYFERALRYRRLKLPHENASGDFLLMHNHQWCILRGYPQWSWRSHIDSLMVCRAITKYKEVIFEEPLYHQEHTRLELVRDQTISAIKASIFQRERAWNPYSWGLSEYSLSTEEK